MSYLYFALDQQVRTRFEAWITTEFKQLCDFCLRDTRSVPENATLLSPAELGASEASALSSLRVPRSIDSVGDLQIGLDFRSYSGPKGEPPRGHVRGRSRQLPPRRGRSDPSELPRTSLGSDVREER